LSRDTIPKEVSDWLGDINTDEEFTAEKSAEECKRMIEVLVSHGLVKDGVKAESRPKTALKDWLTSGGILEKEAA